MYENKMIVSIHFTYCTFNKWNTRTVS